MADKTILDVSRWQGSIDWAKVKASGKIDGVMLRAMGNSGAGKASKPYLDPYFARNYAECARLGIPVGVYGYFKAVTRAEADKELAFLRSDSKFFCGQQENACRNLRSESRFLL
jgi:GH25 family lysozyme M1 (1,4-beta-N-acetylmuramidase)